MKRKFLWAIVLLCVAPVTLHAGKSEREKIRFVTSSENTATP